MSEESSSGTLQRSYVSPNPAAQTSLTLAHVDGTSPSTGAYNYYMHDNLGSTRSVFDQNKAAAAEFTYTPFGGALQHTGPADITDRFTGHTWDATSRLYYAPYRYYAPDAARWMTRDPLGMVDGPNVYQYVREVSGTDH